MKINESVFEKLYYQFEQKQINKQEFAEMLGVHISTLDKKIKKRNTKTKAEEITFSRDMLINELVLNMEGVINKADVIKMYNQLENNVINHLLQATPNKSIKLKVFNGIYLLSQYIPDEYRKGEFHLEEHIRFKAKFTIYLKRRLNGK